MIRQLGISSEVPLYLQTRLIGKINKIPGLGVKGSGFSWVNKAAVSKSGGVVNQVVGDHSVGMARVRVAPIEGLYIDVRFDSSTFNL